MVFGIILLAEFVLFLSAVGNIGDYQDSAQDYVDDYQEYQGDERAMRHDRQVIKSTKRKLKQMPVLEFHNPQIGTMKLSQYERYQNLRSKYIRKLRLVQKDYNHNDMDMPDDFDLSDDKKSVNEDRIQWPQFGYGKLVHKHMENALKSYQPYHKVHDLLRVRF